MTGKGNKNQRDGAETERMVVRHLKPVWPEVDRRLREGRMDDEGDLDGVPFTTVQIKRSKQFLLPAWVRATLKQRDEAGNPLCLLIHRKMHAGVGKWDAWMPLWQLTRYHCQEEDPNTWARLQLDTACVVLRDLIAEEKSSRSLPYWSDTESN